MKRDIMLLIMSDGMRRRISEKAVLMSLPNFISYNVCLNSLDNSESILLVVLSNAPSIFLPLSNESVSISKNSKASLSNFSLRSFILKLSISINELYQISIHIIAIIYPRLNVNKHKMYTSMDVIILVYRKRYVFLLFINFNLLFM